MTVDQAEIEKRFEEAFRSVGLTKTAGSPDDPEEDDDSTEEVESVLDEEDEKPHVEHHAPLVSATSLFQHPDAHPYVLDLLLLKTFGPEFLEWDEETLLLAVRREFQSGFSAINMQKVHAIKALHFVDSFWQSWEVFVPCTMAFNSVMPDFQVMQIPTASQCAISVDTANRVRNDVVWSEEMKSYLEVVHRFEGIFCPVEPIDFITIDSGDHPVDCADVSKRWPDVRKSGRAPQDEGVVSEQLRRLLLVHDALKESRADLASQLALLR